MDKENLKLDFIVIGTPRSATTWIWECLREHPQICLPPFKRGLFFVANHKVDEWFFNKCQAWQKRGEVNADYYKSEKIAYQIKELFPQVKLIVSLRNPIEAIYSMYYYNKHFGREKRKNFEQAMPDYISAGLYYQKLQPYLNLFPKSHFLFLIYEDIQKDPMAFIRSIFEFLEVDPDFIPAAVQKKINPIPPPSRIFKLYGKITTFLRNHSTTERLFTSAKALGIRKVKEWAFKRMGHFRRPSMNPKTRQYLQQVFAKDIKNLETLIHRDLSFWR